jgi:Trypsin-like peptidase domain
VSGGRSVKLLKPIGFVSFWFFVMVPEVSGKLISRSCPPIQSVSFTPVEEGLRELNQPLALIATAVDFRTDKERCSGNFISDDGHILLASHCLTSCDPQSDLNSKTSPIARDLTCEASVNGMKQRFHVEFKSRCSQDADLAAIIARSKGTSVPAQYQHCGAAADLAVVKLDHMPVNSSCLEMSTKAPELGESVFSLSRPAFTSRGGDPRNSNGRDLYATSGKVVRSQKCQLKEVSKNFLSVLMMDFSSESGEKSLGENAEFFSNHYLQATVDAQVGSSGSSLLDKNGRVAGVIVRINHLNNELRECEGATYSEPIGRITETAKSWKADYDLSKIKCEKSRAIKRRGEVDI